MGRRRGVAFKWTSKRTKSRGHHYVATVGEIKWRIDVVKVHGWSIDWFILWRGDAFVAILRTRRGAEKRAETMLTKEIARKLEGVA